MPNSYFYLYFEPWSESEILRVVYWLSYGMGLTLTSYRHWSKAIIIISLVEMYCCFALWLLLCDIKVLDACDYVENGTLLTSPRCKNNGNCVNGTRSDSPGSFGCDCAIGYRGQFCQEGLVGHLALVIIYSTYVCLWHQLIYSDKITYRGFLCAYVNWYSRQLCIGHWYAAYYVPRRIWGLGQRQLLVRNPCQKSYVGFCCMQWRFIYATLENYIRSHLK